MNDEILIECPNPECRKDTAHVFAENGQNGRIGCICLECRKSYITRDPENGWDEFLKINTEVCQDLQSLHGIDIRTEILNMFLDMWNKLGV